jgi:hypothetical protein
MILANVRSTLGRRDAQLALHLIGRDSGAEYARGESLLANEGLDALLDDERLLTALMESRQGTHASLSLFTYVVVRHALRRLGEQDRMIADYVAAVMLHFGVKERAIRVGESDDEVYTTLAELCTALESADTQRSFLVRAHLGNYALWLSGLFPDYIVSRRWRRGGPDLDYYEVMGQRGFRLAAEHRLADEHGLTSIFGAAAERFVLLRMALNAVSDRLLFPNVQSADRLMRQVSDEDRWRRMN